MDFPLMLVCVFIMITLTSGQYHQVPVTPSPTESNIVTEEKKSEETLKININDTSECPATTMYQTAGPVNIYLHTGTASTHRDDSNPSTDACNCPPGPPGTKGDKGDRGLQGPPGDTQESRSDTQHNTTETYVAFFAKMQLQYGPHNEYRRVVFDHVVTNFGNAYNRYRGVFTAPVNGLYEFHVHIHTVVKNKAEVKLRVGRIDIVSAWADSESGLGQNHEMGSSNSMILHLRKGEMVYCVLPKGQALAGLGFTSFLGHLLKTDAQIGYTKNQTSQDPYITDDILSMP